MNLGNLGSLVYAPWLFLISLSLSSRQHLSFIFYFFAYSLSYSTHPLGNYHDYLGKQNIIVTFVMNAIKKMTILFSCAGVLR